MTRLPDPFATRSLGAGVSAERTGTRLCGEPAERWRRGAGGERQTAAILEPLRLAGWVVLHDRSVAGATANIDHLVCDGRTLLVLDSKVWRGKVSRLSDGQLWYADGPVATRLEALVHLGDAVRAACRRRPLLAALDVRPIAVIATAHVDELREPGAVDLVPQADILRTLSRNASGTPPTPGTADEVARTFPSRGR